MNSPARSASHRISAWAQALMLASAAALASSAQASAQDLSGGGESRQLGAHIHGEAQLSVALDASGLIYAELSSPAWNLYGFEGEPASEEQRQRAIDIHVRLSQSGLLAWPARADCTLSETAIAGGVRHEGAHSGHDDDELHPDPDHPGHDHHGPDNHDHGDHDHDHHDHGDHDQGAGDASHSDVVVSWTYQCARIQSAGRIDAAGLFEALARLETIQAQAFDGGFAAVRTLSRDDAVLTLD